MTHLGPPAMNCSNSILCQCLQVTEAEVVTAITTLELRTVKDVRQCTGAGDGCTCCHRRIRDCLAQAAAGERVAAVAG